MSAAVWLHDGPVGSGPGAVRLPSEEVQEYFDPVLGTAWMLLDAGDLALLAEQGISPECRTRVVSPVVDLPEGRLWHAVEQPPERGWCNYCDARGDHTTERHFSLRAPVVVGYSDTRQVDGELRWESVVMLDQPIAEMACDELHEPDYEADPEDWPSCGEFVPLQLVPGWNPSVELETP